MIFAINRCRLAQTVFIIVSILLIGIMVTHAFVPHDHSEALFGNAAYAFLHGMDRKFIFLIFSFLTLAVIFSRTLLRGIFLSSLKYPAHTFLKARHDIFKIHGLLFQGLQRGILNSKLY